MGAPRMPAAVRPLRPPRPAAAPAAHCPACLVFRAGAVFCPRCGDLMDQPALRAAARVPVPDRPAPPVDLVPSATGEAATFGWVIAACAALVAWTVWG